MIDHFVSVSLQDPQTQTLKETYRDRYSLSLGYPCTNPFHCAPYTLKLKPAIYKIECWGARGEYQYTFPGLGAYTSGTIFIHKTTTLYLYIGATGSFNCVKDITESVYGYLGGGATDLRLNTSKNWWDDYSLISRIMVAAGGGSSEWNNSVGGNGGEIEGVESYSSLKLNGSLMADKPCRGAKQTEGTECPEYDGQVPKAGIFGSAGHVTPFKSIFNEEDYGGFGGGGYYGGTSYPYTYAGSGGSSFISGHEGCNAVKEQVEKIEHTGSPVHYSRMVFTNTIMHSGNTEMPLPTSKSSTGIWNEKNGAFRISLIIFSIQSTFKVRFYLSIYVYVIVYSSY